MESRVLRWTIPIDDLERTLADCRGQVLPVAEHDGMYGISFWTVEFDTGLDHLFPLHVFRVFGTGHPIPDGHSWRASTPRHPATGLVWHLFDRTTQ